MKIAKKQLTQELLKQFLHYDPITGYFTWIAKHCNKVMPGKRAGSISKRDNKRVIHFAGSLHMEHRLAWLYMTGAYPKGHIDHIDHNECNNAFNNLRDVAQKDNNKNLSIRNDNKTNEIGIYINKYNTYQVDVRSKTSRFCRAFKTMEAAIIARDTFYQKHSFHINHGNIKPT